MIVQGASGWNLNVAYALIFFDGIISTSTPDCKTNESHFAPLGHFQKTRQIQTDVFFAGGTYREKYWYHQI